MGQAMKQSQSRGATAELLSADGDSKFDADSGRRASNDFGRLGVAWGKGPKSGGSAGIGSTAEPSARTAEMGYQLRPTPKLRPCSHRSEFLKGTDGRGGTTCRGSLTKFGMRLTSRTGSI